MNVLKYLRGCGKYGSVLVTFYKDVGDDNAKSHIA